MFFHFSFHVSPWLFWNHRHPRTANIIIILVAVGVAQSHVVCGHNRRLFRVLLLPPDHQKADHDDDQLPPPMDGHWPEYGDLQRWTGNKTQEHEPTWRGVELRSSWKLNGICERQ